jgi:hypothetical protein
MSSLLLRLTKPSQGAVGIGPGGTENCILWLRADRQHPTSPSVVELDGSDRVETWYDQSGLENHVSQSVPSWRPLWQADTVTCFSNLLPSIFFDGVDDFLSGSFISDVADFKYDANPAGAIYVVFRAGNQNSTVFSLRDSQVGPSTDGTHLSLAPNTISTSIETDTDTVAALATPIYATSETHIYEVLFDSELGSVGNENLKLFFDTGLAQTSNSIGTTLKSESDEINIGRFGSGSTTHFVGELLEIVVYSEASLITKSVVEEYLSNKWCSGIVGVGPGSTDGTFWWWSVTRGLPNVLQPTRTPVDEWVDKSGRRILAIQSDPANLPQHSLPYNNTVGGVNFGHTISFPAQLIQPASTAFLEATGVSHNLNEITQFSVAIVSSTHEVGNLFAWGDGTDRQIVLEIPFTTNDSILTINTLGGAQSFSIPAVFADGRQLNDLAPPNSASVLTLKILTVDLTAGTALWHVGFPTDSVLVASVPVLISPSSTAFDIGTTIRLGGVFSGTTFPGTTGQYNLSELAFYNHSLDSVERDDIFTYFKNTYGNGALVTALLGTPFVGSTPTTVIIPVRIVDPANGTVKMTAGGPSIFRSTISPVDTSPPTPTNPNLIGAVSDIIVSGTGLNPNMVFIDTVPGPGTYFYRGRLGGFPLTVPPGTIALFGIDSNEVSITV